MLHSHVCSHTLWTAIPLCLSCWGRRVEDCGCLIRHNELRGRLTSHPHSEEAGEPAVSAHPVKWLSVVMRKDHLESSYSLIFLMSIIIKARCIQHDYVANSVCGHELGREAAAAVQAVR